MLQKGFIFDLNKCVGCHACRIACRIENAGSSELPWRGIHTFNPIQHTGLPVYHFSLACNHCEEAPCMKSCPAGAYTRDQKHGAVVFHEEQCIGCTYCTWTCPYDAPKYNKNKGIIEKCTFCLDRLKAGAEPACTAHCPVGALEYGPLKTTRSLDIPGFTEKKIRPGIEIIPLRKTTPPVGLEVSAGIENSLLSELSRKKNRKTSLRNEWTLIIFTILSPLLVAVFAASLAGQSYLPDWLYLAACFAGMGISTLHLGSKMKAWRAILNLRTSWLSREILFYLLFITLSSIHYFIPETKAVGYAGLISGILLLIAIDMVYLFAERVRPVHFHSSGSLIAGATFASLLTGFWYAFVFLLLLKGFVFILRNSNKKDRKGFPLRTAAYLRMMTGIVVPVVWLIMDPFVSTGIIFALVLAGDLIDRAGFYLDLEINHPAEQINRDMAQEMRKWSD